MSASTRDCVNMIHIKDFVCSREKFGTSRGELQVTESLYFPKIKSELQGSTIKPWEGQTLQKGFSRNILDIFERGQIWDSAF